MRLWLYYAKGSLRACLRWRVAPTIRCSRCRRRRWAEEIIVNCGWCDRCFDQTWAS